MKDAKTLAYINMYAILGSLPVLCALDGEAKSLIDGENVSIGFSVKGGPCATLKFEGGVCSIYDGCEKCRIKLPFSSPEKFNGMIDGTVTPIPVRGFTKIGFLLKKFTKLTDILSRYLRADKESLSDEKFFEVSTRLMLNVIGNAIIAIGNHDKIGMASASYIVDGNIRLEIKDCASFTIHAENHVLSVADTDDIMSYMQFRDIRLARALFDGEVNAVTCIGLGEVRCGGMMSQVDNVNRILDRVSVYLA